MAYVPEIIKEQGKKRKLAPADIIPIKDGAIIFRKGLSAKTINKLLNRAPRFSIIEMDDYYGFMTIKNPTARNLLSLVNHRRMNYKPVRRVIKW